MSDHIPLKCNSCGSGQFLVPDNPTADSIVTCGGCGASNKYGILQQQALKQGKDMVEKMFKDAFKKWK